MVAFDAVGPSSSGFYSAAFSGSGTFSHTNNGNAIVVGITDVTGTTNQVTAVSYGGVALPFIGYIPSDGPVSGSGGISVYGKIGGLPTGANTVSITSGASTVCAGAISFTAAGTFGSAFTAFASAISVSVTVTGTTSGGMIVAFGCYGGAGNTTFSALSGGTQRISCTGDSGGGANNLGAATWASPGGSQSVGLTVATGGNDFWGLVAVEVVPPAGGAAAPVTQFRPVTRKFRSRRIQGPWVPRMTPPVPAAQTLQGAADLAGTGSIDAALAAQLAGAALAGTGSIGTALAVQLSGAVLAGAASLSTALAAQGAATLAGTGTLGDVAAQGSSGTLAGTGSLATAAVQGSAATLAGTGSLAAPARQQAGATLGGGGSLTAGASQGTTGTTLGGAGSLTASPPLKLRSARTVTTGAGSATLAVPAQPVAVGDIIFIWAAAGFVALTFTSAPGDSLTAEAANSPASGSPAMSTQLFWKIADASDVAKAAAAGSYTITISTFHPFSAAIGVVPVTSTAHPYDPSDTPGSGQSNAASLTVTAAGVTTANNPDLLIWLGADRATAGGVPPAMTVPAGYAAPSGVTQANSSGTGTVNTGVLMATATQFTPGATGSPAGSIGASQVTAGLLLAVKAAPVAAIPGTVSQLVTGAPASSSLGVVAKTSGATSCRLAYSTNSGMTSPSYVAAQTPDSLGYVRFTVTGLTAHTRYYVQVTDTPAGGTETLIGPVGQGKTLPAAGSPQNFTVAFGSCIAAGDTTTPPARDAAIADWISYDPDLSVFLGDFDYSGTTSTDTPTQVGVYESQISGVPSLASMVSTRWGYYCRSDHEAGPDNGDSNNAYTATNIAAAQAVFPFGTLGDTVNSPVHGLYQAWVVGRVRFIMIDIRNTDRSPGSNTDNSSKTMLGATQLSWLQGQLTQPEPLKVILSDVAWMGPASITNGPDKWWSYDTERQAIISYIAANQAQVGNVMLWHGDSHLVGCTQGAANTWGAFSVLCAAPLLNTGGGLNTSTFTSFYNNAGGECRLYGRVAISDDGNAITVAYQGWDAASGTAQVSQTDVFPTPTAGLNAAGSLASGGGIAGAATLAGTGTLGDVAAQGTAGTTLAGGGSLSAPVTQRAGAALNGAGSLTAAVTGQAGAVLPGTGSVAALPVQQAGASLGAAGSLGAAPAQGGGTTLPGSGSLAAPAVQGASAVLAGTGSLAAQPGGGGAGSAALAGAGSLATAATQLAPATLAGQGSLTGAAAQGSSGTLSGTGTLNAPLSVTRAPAALAGAGSLTTAAAQLAPATLAGTGSLAAAVTQTAGSALNGAGAISASPAVLVPGSAALGGAGALSTAARLSAGASLAGTGTLNASGGGGTFASSALAGTGSLAAGAAVLPPAALAGTGSLTAPASIQLAGAVLTGTGSLAQAVTQRAVTTLAGTGSLSGSGVIPGSVTLAGTGALNQPGSLSGSPAALAGTGTLASASVLRAAAALAGTGTLASAAGQRSSAVLAGTGSLTALGSTHPPQVKGGSTGWSVIQPFPSAASVSEDAGTSASASQAASPAAAVTSQPASSQAAVTAAAGSSASVS